MRIRSGGGYLTSLVALTFCGAVGCGRAGTSTPDANTPVDVLMEMRDAIRQNDAQRYARCLPAETPEEKRAVEAMVAMFHLSPRARAFIKAGEAKFGAEPFTKAIFFVEPLLSGLSQLPSADEVNQMIAQGKVSVQGDHATMKFVQIGARAADDGISRASANFVRRKGRWYFDPPKSPDDEQAQRMVTMMPVFSAFVDAATKELAAASTAHDFDRRLMPHTTKLAEAMHASVTGAASKGAEPSRQTVDPKVVDALTSAIRRADAEAVKKYIDQKLPLDARDSSESTPLFEAVERGRLQIVKMLLDAGASVAVRSGTSDRPAVFAILRASNREIASQMLKLLSAAGADLHALDAMTQTVMDHAVRQQRLEVIDALLANGFDAKRRNGMGGTAMDTAVMLGERKVLQHLIASKVPVDLPGSLGMTPLMHAVAVGKDAELVTDLLRAGANINARNVKGATPLMIGAQVGNAELVKLLLDAKADPNIMDEFDRTALDWAAKQQNVRVLTLLQQHGGKAGGAAP